MARRGFIRFISFISITTGSTILHFNNKNCTLWTEVGNIWVKWGWLHLASARTLQSPNISSSSTMNTVLLSALCQYYNNRICPRLGQSGAYSGTRPHPYQFHANSWRWLFWTYNMLERRIPNFKKIYVFWRFYSSSSSKKGMTFFHVHFFSSTHRRRKLTTYLESWGNSESETLPLCKNIDLKNLTLFDLILAWSLSKLNFNEVIGSNDHHYRYLRAKRPINHVSHGMLVTFIFSDYLWPDLGPYLFKYDIRIYAVPSVDI